MSNICAYETRIKRPLSTSVMRMETYIKWKDCKTNGPSYELTSKLSELSGFIWNGDLSPEELKNLDAYLKRWNHNPCNMVIDMLTVNTTCLDAFLKWDHDAFPPPPTPPSSFLSPMCYQTRGTCDPSEKQLRKLQTYLYRFQYQLRNGCPPHSKTCASAFEEVGNAIVLLEHSGGRVCSQPVLSLLLSVVNGQQMCLHWTNQNVLSMVAGPPPPPPSPSPSFPSPPVLPPVRATPPPKKAQRLAIGDNCSYWNGCDERMEEFKGVCVFDVIPTEPVPWLQLHSWKRCKKNEADPLVGEKLYKFSSIIWYGPRFLTEAEMKNMDAFYKRWNKDPCTMELDYLTKDLSCMDAFLQKYSYMDALSHKYDYNGDTIPPPLPPPPPPPAIAPLQNAFCWERKDACEKTCNTYFGECGLYKLEVARSILSETTQKTETKDCFGNPECAYIYIYSAKALYMLLTGKDFKNLCEFSLLRSLFVPDVSGSLCLDSFADRVQNVTSSSLLAEPSFLPAPPILLPPLSPLAPPPPPLRNGFCWERRDASANTCREHWKEDGVYKYDSAHDLLLESTNRMRNKDCFDDPVCASLYTYSSHALSVLLSGKNLCKFSHTRSLFVPDASGYLCLHSFVDSVNNVTTPPLPLTEPSFPSPSPRLVVQSRLASSLFLAYLGAWLLSVLVGFFCCRFTSAPPMRTGHPRVRWRRGRLSSPLAPALLPPRKKAPMV